MDSIYIPEKFELIEKKYGKFLLSKDGDLVEQILKSNELDYIWDREIVEEIEKHINLNSIIADVGAYIGEQAIYLSKKVKHIHAFEPHPEKFKQLNKNIDINHISNITTYNVALSANDGYCSLNSTPGNTADTKITPGKDIEMIKLDNLNLDLDLLKIDAQGHDYFVVQGALETIKRCKTIIIFEYEPFSTKKMADFYTLFDSLDYEIKSINYPPPPSLEHPNNYIAFPR